MHNKSNKKLQLLVSFALMQMFNSSAIAETEESTAIELQTVEVRATKDTGGLYQPAKTTTGTKTNTLLRDIPQTINVITKETWRDQGARTLNDTLHSVPGVSVLAGDGARDQVLIRGFSSQNDNLVDGFRDDATYYRDLANIERIEVIKGPAAAIYGRGGSGGLINRITKKPMFETLYEVGGIAGSYDVKRGEIDFNQPLSDTVAVRLAASVEDSESFRDQYFMERHLIAPSVLFKPSESTSLLFQIDYLDDRRLDDLGIPFRIGGPLDVKRSQYYGSLNGKKDDYIQTNSSGATISFDHAFDSGLKIRNVFRATDLEQDRNDTRAPGFTATTFTRQHTNINREDKGTFNQTDLMLDVDGFGMKHALLAGLELNHQDKDSWGSRFNVTAVDQLNPVLTSIVYGTATTPTYANFKKRWYTPLPSGTRLLSVTNTNHDTNTVGVYAQDLVTINPQWKVLAGLRYDQFKQDTTDYMRLKTDVRRNISRTDYTLSPRLGVVYQPNDYASVYTSVSRSYQPTGIDGALSFAARDLEPERTTNYEVGAKLDLMGGSLSAQAALFSLERTNTRLTVNDASGNNRQGGETRTNGLELSVAGRPADGWDVISAYTYLDSVIVKSDGVERVTGLPDVQLEGNRVPMVAKHSANLWLTKRFANGFGVGGGVTSTGKRYITSGERAWMPGYTRFDATAFYETKKYEVRLNVYNLFDLHYTDAATGGNENGAIPGVPLSALVSAKYRF
jgi:catecholate siderophore receptor